MKKISIFMLAVSSTLVFGQKVSDYKYVSIPEQFHTFKNGSYGLEAHLAKTLKGKKYVVLPINKDQWPAEAKNNSCGVINADILDNSNFLTNRVIVQFTDCNNKVIFESKGRSSIKQFEEGFADALNQALTLVAVSNPFTMLPAQVYSSSNSQIPASEVSTSSVVSTMAGNFSNGKLDVQKIEIDNRQFILAKAGSSVPFAVFKPSSKKGVFIVKLADGNVTVGYFENGSIVIDMPQAEGRYSKDIFVGK